jgi:hypothetical protein
MSLFVYSALMARSRALIRIAVAFAVVGALLVAAGLFLVDDSNARVQYENSITCGEANCTALAPGSEQPEGLVGAALVLIGALGMTGALIAGVWSVVARRNERRGRPRP